MTDTVRKQRTKYREKRIMILFFERKKFQNNGEKSLLQVRVFPSQRISPFTQTIKFRRMNPWNIISSHL